MGKQLKIALIFPSGHFYNTPCVPNLAKYLARNGVQIVVFSAKNKAAPEGSLAGDNLKIIYFPIEQSRSKESVALLTASFGFWLSTKLITGKYDYLIGCGIRGLFVTGIVAQIFGIKYAYNSLELYSGPKYEKGLRKHFKWFERYFNKRALFSIIQDEKRAELLAKTNLLATQRIGLFPNAPYQSGCEIYSDSPDIKYKFGIPNNCKLVVYSGSLTAPWAGVRKILASVSAFPDRYILFLQARTTTNSDLGQEIDDLKKNGKLVLSRTPLSDKEYDCLVKQADIGIAWYESNEDNIHYVGLSSGKVAHYLCWGKPVIINNLPLYNEIVDKYQCGIVVNSAVEIGAAIEKINAEYSRYVEGAKKAYVELFDMDQCARNLLEIVESQRVAE